MANTADWTAVNGDMTLGYRAMSKRTVCTLFSIVPLIAALGVTSGNKADDLFNVGLPDAGVVLSGAPLTSAQQKYILECDQYDPFLRAQIQSDTKRMGIRDTNPVMSRGTGATLTLTLNSGAVGTVTVSASSSDFTGALPTIRVNDVASGGGPGFGALLLPVIGTASQIASVTIVSGGYGYSTNSTATVVTSLSAGEKYQRPIFKWTHMKTAGTIYNHDFDRFQALPTDDFNSAVNNVLMDDEQEKIGWQAQEINRDLHVGIPTNQTQSLWDYQWGLNYAIDDSSVYAGVDRTLAANAYWRAIKDTTAHTFSLVQLWQDANVSKGIVNTGGTIDAFFVGPALFNKFQQETLSYQQNANIDPAVQMLMGVFGFKNMPLKYMNTLVFLDPWMAANQVYGVNTKAWMIAFKKGEKFRVEGPYDQAPVSGGIDGKIYYVNTQYMAICQAPNFGNIQYTNVS